MPTKRMEADVRSFLADVVDNGYCVGCGACASVPDSPLRMQMDEFGMYAPVAEVDANAPDVSKSEQVCPFYSVYDEDATGRELFADGASHDPRVGFYRAIYTGYARCGGFRSEGSSGGLTTWVLAKLMAEGLVDGVIHVKPRKNADDPLLFRYGVSRSIDEVTASAKTRYYPVEFSEAIRILRENPGRYAFVGVPCFVKAVRLLAKQDPIVASSIRYCVSIFCGHLKSRAFAESLAWQMGIEPTNLKDFDFRVKLPGKPASRYGVGATGEDGRKAVAPVSHLLGSDWGMGFFRPKGCDYCDDITGETADISMGDAWLPRCVGDCAGTNIVVVRSEEMQRIVAAGIANGELVMDPTDPDEVLESQQGNFRHRREGLRYRLWLADQQGNWRPQKREQPGYDHLTDQRKRICELRMQVSQLSHEAFLEARSRGDLSVFTKRMRPVVWRYHCACGTQRRYLVKSLVMWAKRKLGSLIA